MVNRARRHCASILAACFFFVAHAGTGQVLPGDTLNVLTVNGSPVTVREFLMVAGQLRAGVIARFTGKHGVTYGKDFWTRPVAGSSPSEYLRQITLDTLVKIRIRQAWAAKAGLGGYASYNDFLDMLASENNRRKEAVRNHRVIYGPVTYSEPVYYNYLVSSQEAALQAMVRKELESEGEKTIEQAYGRLRDTLCRYGYLRTVSYLRIAEKGVRPPHGPEGRERIHGLLQPYEKRSGMDENIFTKAAAALAGDTAVAAETGVRVFNDTVPVPEGDDFGNLLRQEAVSLAPGRTGEAVPDGRSLVVVLLVGEKDLGCRDFSACRNRILLRMAEVRFRSMLDQAAREADIKVDRTVYDSLVF